MPRAVGLCGIKYLRPCSTDTPSEGSHRVAQTMRAGAQEIEAVRFDVDPPPDHVGKGPDDLPYPDSD